MLFLGCTSALWHRLKMSYGLHRRHLCTYRPSGPMVGVAALWIWALYPTLPPAASHYVMVLLTHVNHMVYNCQPAHCQTLGTPPGSTECASARSCAPTTIHSAPSLHQVQGGTHAPTGTASWPWCGMGWAGPALEIDTKPQAADSIPRASHCCVVTALQCTSLVACPAACTRCHTSPQQHLLSHCPGTQWLQLGRLGRPPQLPDAHSTHSLSRALAHGLMLQTCSIMSDVCTAPRACM